MTTDKVCYLELYELAYDVNSYLQEKEKSDYSYVVLEVMFHAHSTEMITITVHTILSKRGAYRVVFDGYLEATYWLKNVFSAIKKMYEKTN